MDETIGSRLSWQQTVDRYTEYLVEVAEKSVSDERMRQMRRAMRTSQFSNLLAVALATDSVAAITSWIYYQMGRRETRQAWKQSGLGDDIIDAIRQMRGQAEEAARNLYGETASKQQIMAIHVAMVRLYVGYMRRWFIAKGGQN